MPIDDPDLAAVPVALGVHDLADGAVLDPFNGFAVAAHVAPLGAGGNPQPLLLRQLAGFHDHLDAGDVDGRRLFDKHVFARLDRGLQVHRAEVGRRGQDDVIDLGDTQQLLVRVEAGEALCLGHVEPKLVQLLLARSQAVLEQVGQGDDLDVLFLDLGAFGHVLGVVAEFRINHVRRGAHRV